MFIYLKLFFFNLKVPTATEMFISPKDAATWSGFPASSFDCINDDCGADSCSCAYAFPLTSTPCAFCPSFGGVESFRAAAAADSIQFFSGEIDRKSC